MPKIRSEKELKALQLKGLKWTIKHTYANSKFYKGHFDEYGVTPEDIRTLDDLSKLPFTQANDLKKDYPFPLLSVPLEKVVRIHASSGTT
jgi:phenylacetate-CoA ligase